MNRAQCWEIGAVWCGVVWCGVVWCGVPVRAQPRAPFLRCSALVGAASFWCWPPLPSPCPPAAQRPNTHAPAPSSRAPFPRPPALKPCSCVCCQRGFVAIASMPLPCKITPVSFACCASWCMKDVCVRARVREGVACGTCVCVRRKHKTEDKR